MRLFRFSYIPNKVAVWLGVFLTSILFFAIYRLFFLIAYFGLAEKCSIIEILKSFWIGFRFDSAIISVVIGPLFLISLLPFIRFSQKAVRVAFTAILTAVFALMFLICTADLRFFEHFGSRMNYWAVEYIDSPGLMLYSSATATYFWHLLILWILISILFFFAVRWVIKRLSGFNLWASMPVKTVTYILALALLAYGVRGRIGMKGLDWGTAFFSENPFVNQLSLNGVFTLSHSIYEEWKDGTKLLGEPVNRFAFYDNNDAYQMVRKMLGLPPNSNADRMTLEHRVVARGKWGYLPNIVLIILESWSDDRVGALGSNLGVTPRFDSLSAHGILFRNFYANGVRTNRGIPAVLGSFPSLPGRSIMKRYAADYPFRSIAGVLNDYNYNCIFAYGGDIEFDNMRGFLKAVGFDKFYDEGDFGPHRKLGKWGVPDHLVFETLIGEIAGFKRPFNLSIMALSNHEPYYIPDDRFRLYDDSIPDSRRLNAFYYSDWAIGEFVDSLRKYPVFDSTIFVFTSDHSPHQSSEYPLDPGKFHIPLMIYAPGILGDKGRVVERTASQVDVIPTIVGMLGIDASVYSWGRDQLNFPDSDTGFAILVDEDKLGLVEGSKFFFHWVNVEKRLYDLNDTQYLKRDLTDSFPDIAATMEKRLNSYVQLASYLSKGGIKK